jgi:hypothetical protein
MSLNLCPAHSRRASFYSLSGIALDALLRSVPLKIKVSTSAVPDAALRASCNHPSSNRGLYIRGAEGADARTVVTTPQNRGLYIG